MKNANTFFPGVEELGDDEMRVTFIGSSPVPPTPTKSAREFYPVFLGTELYAMKWRNYKMHLIWQERMFDPPTKLAVPRLIDLYDNPQERIEETVGESAAVTRGWVLHAMFGQMSKFQESLKKYPPIPMGTSDPYQPSAAR